MHFRVSAKTKRDGQTDGGGGGGGRCNNSRPGPSARREIKRAKNENSRLFLIIYLY